MIWEVMNMSKKWIGVFAEPGDVRATVDELQGQGFEQERISVIGNYRTEMLVEDDIPGAKAFEVGGVNATAAFSQSAGLNIPDKESELYEEYVRSGRFLLIADEDQQSSAEIYQIFQRHHALIANYYPSPDEIQEEHFYGVQKNADTYYGDQKASMDGGTNSKN
jgi:hypothetical protein